MSDPSMSAPDWRTSTAGGRVRVALWLVAEVGVGCAFTKAQLREAFPLVEQIDRRMRDLRAEGWVIATYREDRSLAQDELRLVGVGARVWEVGYRPRTDAVSARERRAVFSHDDYMCRYCGISAGEAYPDDPVRTAKLSAARVPSDVAPQLLTLCDRCLVGSQDTESAERLLDEIRALDRDERRRLFVWIQGGQRKWTRAELLWARFRRLPATSRESVQAGLADDLE
jgi:5-methylcytosine-specific restriction endonuclease McrA